MKKTYLSIALAAALIGVPQAWAVDQVKRVGSGSVTGTLTGMTATSVTIEKAGGVAETVQLDDVDSVIYDGEPTGVKTARSAIAAGNFESALEALKKLDPATIENERVKADIAYYTAYCKAKLAMVGNGDATEAGRLMVAFIGANPSNYHLLAANEVVGDLLVATANYEAASAYYKKLADSPFQAYKLRASVALGRANLAQGKFAEAKQSFDTVLKLAGTSTGAVIENQKLAATLGMAACMADEGQVDAAIAKIQESIAKIAPEEGDLHAQAYLALGNCYLKKGPTAVKDALLSYLRVHVLYYGNPQNHAESLYRMAPLWTTLGKNERAAECTTLLKQRYPSSMWANK